MPSVTVRLQVCCFSKLWAMSSCKCSKILVIGMKELPTLWLGRSGNWWGSRPDSLPCFVCTVHSGAAMSAAAGAALLRRAGSSPRNEQPAAKRPRPAAVEWEVYRTLAENMH